jgi:hypothetical protein
MSFRLPAAMMNACTPTTRLRPAARSARNSSAAEAAIRRPALDDDEVQAQQREDADQAQLLAEGGEREVRVHGRDREPAPNSGSPAPSPVPRTPPRANAYSACTTW